MPQRDGRALSDAQTCAPSWPPSCALSADELTDWLRLQQTAGVGPATARVLLSAFGLPKQIFAADLPALLQVVSPRVAHGLLAPLSTATRALIDTTLSWLAQPGNAVLSLADAAYPHALLEIADPPLLLYAKGRIALLAQPALAIVGSRNASAQGLANAARFAESLSAAGLTIVSGLALGIDASAHDGALRNGAGGSTIAVIGTGCDGVYPARNRELAHRIAEHGCIVSEYPLGTKALAANFPRRNRLISGLSRGVLVIEAAAQSGSLITARMAAEQGRDVFAIPGSIHSPLAKGCHYLIKEGAKLVESAQDVLQELNLAPPVVAAAPAMVGVAGGAAAHLGSDAAPAATPLNGEYCAGADAALLDLIGFEAVDPDTLAVRAALSAAALNAALLELELRGAVERLPGGAYRRLVI